MTNQNGKGITGLYAIPRVSVIICCYTEDRLDDIRMAVKSVRDQTLPPQEIILSVDGNQGLYERLQKEVDLSVRVVLNGTGRGLSAARNAGIAAAQGDLVAFLDDDAIAMPDWLDNLVEVFEDPTVIGAGGSAALAWTKDRPFWFPEELDWTVGGSPSWLERGELRNPQGNNMCFRRWLFECGTVFSPSFGRYGQKGQIGEEAEFCWRLKSKMPHAKIVYEPRSIIVHRVPPLRGCWSYVIKRSFQEGEAKGMISRDSRTHTFLAVEARYLRNMLFCAVPRRLVTFWRPRAFTQVLAILLSVTAAVAGYAFGSLHGYFTAYRGLTKFR